MFFLASTPLASGGSFPADKLPVIGYHEFDGPPEYEGGPKFDVHGLNIPLSAFQTQLDLLYRRGFYPVNMRDMILKRYRVPKGKRPVILTFDDGRASQYRILEDGTLDPNCAVAVLLKFHKEHQDWPLRGTFYIIAGSDQNGVPFDQEGMEKRKIQQLLAWGFEIGNHSLTHPSFKELTRQQIAHEVAGGDAYLKSLVPGIKVNTFALPYGDVPKNQKDWKLLRSCHGKHYRNIGVLLFDEELNPARNSRDFNPYQIDRMAPDPGKIEALLK